MPTDEKPGTPAPGGAEENRAEGTRPRSPAAERALAEAAARRAERDLAATGGTKEKSGRGGLDPTRYGDWEVNGLASDF
jgi:hypothetical protein